MAHKASGRHVLEAHVRGGAHADGIGPLCSMLERASGARS